MFAAIVEPTIVEAAMIRSPGNFEPVGEARFQRHENSEPVLEVGQSANRLVKPLSAARSPEKTDDYRAIVTRLNERWRVIEPRRNPVDIATAEGAMGRPSTVAGSALLPNPVWPSEMHPGVLRAD